MSSGGVCPVLTSRSPLYEEFMALMRIGLNLAGFSSRNVEIDIAPNGTRPSSIGRTLLLYIIPIK
jgi:hypothetical protein